MDIDEKINYINEINNKNWFIKNQKKTILKNLDDNECIDNCDDNIPLSLPKTNLKYLYLNSWSVKCSLIGIIFTILIMIFPFILFKTKIISETGFIIVFLSIFFISIALMIRGCNYNNSYFITRAKLI